MFVEFANISSVEELKSNGLPSWPLKEQWYNENHVPLTEKRTFNFRALVDLFVDYISHCDKFSNCQDEIGSLEYVDLMSSVKIAHIKKLGSNESPDMQQKSGDSDKQQKSGESSESQQKSSNIQQSPSKNTVSKDIERSKDTQKDVKSSENVSEHTHTSECQHTES